MIIKLDTSLFRLARPKTESNRIASKPLTKAQWINADRIVMAILFIVTIAGAILF
ncbi:hypothetical protein [Pedobacter yonginense]|uniref:hypothetical protein n=1 Tax=Pedobacter yonginense TaxID=651869 RepID=UPI001402945F|nr:hypothetical protein [Pedobacter yonginense]